MTWPWFYHPEGEPMHPPPPCLLTLPRTLPDVLPQDESGMRSVNDFIH